MFVHRDCWTVCSRPAVAAQQTLTKVARLAQSIITTHIRILIPLANFGAYGSGFSRVTGRPAL